MKIHNGLIENAVRVLSSQRAKYGSCGVLLPAVLTIHPTNRCNHSCSWCYFKRGCQEINIDNIVALLGYIDSISPLKEIVISGGGEPLLHKDIELLFKALTKYQHVHRRLYTNGHFIYDHVHSIAKSFDYVRVSLDAGSGETYAQIHGVSVNKFEEILESMRALLAVNKSLDVYASFVVEDRNDQEIQLLIDRAVSYGICGVVFKSLINDGIRQQSTNGLSIGDKNKVNVVVRQENMKLLDGSPPSIEYSSINIVCDANGNIYPCCHLTTNQFCIAENTVENFKVNYGSKRHVDILKRYSRQPHSCRAHSLWGVHKNG